MSQKQCIKKKSSFCLNYCKFKNFSAKCWHLVVKNENFIISLHNQFFDFCTINLHDSLAQWKPAGLLCRRSWVQSLVVPNFFQYFFLIILHCISNFLFYSIRYYYAFDFTQSLLKTINIMYVSKAFFIKLDKIRTFL